MIRELLQPLARALGMRRIDHRDPSLDRLCHLGIGPEINKTAELGFPERISIGDYVYVGPFTELLGRGGLTIHDHVIIAGHVTVLTTMHNYVNASMVPYDSVQLMRPVIIERCVWIGTRAIIMPGVTIGEGSIIGAGAVVTKSCEPGSVMAGNPARLVKRRDMEHYRTCVEDGRFYLKLKRELGLVREEVQDL